MAGLAGQSFLLISGVLIARILGPEDRGHFAMLVVLGSLATQLVLCGVPQGFTYYLSTRSASRNRLFAVVRRAASYQSLLSIILCASFLLFYVSGKADLVGMSAVILLMSVPAGVLASYGLAGLQGLADYRRFHVLRTAPATSWAAAAIALYLLETVGLFEVVLAWTALQLVVALTIWNQLTRRLPDIEPRGEQEGKGIIEMLRYGAKGMIGYMLPIDTFRIDQIVVGIFLSPAALGVYVVAQAFTNIPKFIAQSVGLIAFPQLASLGTSEKSRASIGYFLLTANILVLPLGVVVVVFMPLIVRVLFGEGFADATPIARVLIFAAVVAANRRLVGEILRGLGMPQLSTFVEIASLSTFGLSAALLIPGFGAFGMALTVLITHAVGCLMSLLLLVRHIRRTTLNSRRASSNLRPSVG